MSTPANLVYVAYGRRDVLTQAHYAVLSALAFRGQADIAVHLFTDAPEIFGTLADAVVLHPFSADDIQSLRGPGDYPFRVKIAVLARMAQQHPERALIFADADTFFFAPIERLLARVAPGRAALHRREYDVATFPTLQVRKFRARMRRLAPEVELQGAMWNSGVVGVSPAQFGVFADMLRVIDKVSPHYRKALAEQYAVSYFLQEAATVEACDDVVFHYWYQKDDYQREIESRLAHWRTLPLEQALAELRQQRIVLPPPPRKVRWWERRLHRRLPDFRGLPENRD
jgi:hypothetical protein